jgi:hypothetical protein
MAQPPSRPPRDLPQVSDSVDASIRGPLSRVIEEVQRLLEFRGDPLDAALTTRKAIARGLMDSLGRSLTGSVTYVNTFPGGGGGGGGTAPDLTPPPTVTGLTILAGFTQVLVQFDAPTYSQGHGNLQTNIYAVKKDASDPTLPTFTAGVTPLVYSAPGALNIVSIPSELNTRWHVWAKYKTVDGVESVAAAGGVNGVSDTTGQDIAQLLEVMTASIRESHLHRTLAEPIRSIIRRADDAAEDALRAALAAHNAAQRAAAALLIEAQDRGTSITETRTIVAAGDEQLASTITTLAAVVGTNAAAIQTEATARADGDSAEATARQTLATKLTGLADPSGATLGSITSGLLYDERTTRSGADSALAIRANALEASVDTPSTGLLARASALETVTTAAGSGNSALATRASLLEASVDTGGTGLLARATALETVTTHATSGNSALASRASTLEASVNSPTDINNPTYAALSAESSVRAALDGAVHALYTVRAEVSSGGQTMVGGFGLAATATAGAGPRIDFGVRADQFYVGAPSGSGIADTIPFIIRVTSSTENGVLIPAGVYMDSAYVVNVSAMYGRFGTLIADSIAAGQINAAHLTLGDGTVGGDLKSTSFSAGSGVTPGAGWKLTPAGTLYASNAVIYGTIYASAGVFAGSLNAATGTFAGSLSAATGTFAGSLSAATGTFSGALSAATGTFAGALSAATGTFGAVTLAASGSISSGQTAFNTGTGFWLGIASGVPKFSLGNPSGEHLTWDGTTLSLTDPTFAAFSASITGGDLTVSVDGGVQDYSTRTVSVSGGKAPFAYFWAVTNGKRVGLNPGTTSGALSEVWPSAGSTSSTITLGGAGSGITNKARVACFVRDANGRVTQATFLLSATHAIYSGGTEGGGGDP